MLSLQVRSRNRAWRTFMYQSVDRVADIEFGFWPQTIRRWVAEGFPADWAAEIGDNCFHLRFEQFIASDVGEKLEGGAHLPLHMGINPAFEVQILSEDDKTQVIRDGGGTIARRWKSGTQDSSIPEYLEFPVKDRASWAALKERYRSDDPVRQMKAQDIETARAAAAEGWTVSTFLCGYYGALRNWVGVENLSYLFYDDPALVHEMCAHWAQMALAQLRQVPADVPIHQVHWWEDMSFNHGPLCSVAHFHEFIVPYYQLVMTEAAKHGCRLASVDSDGNNHLLVPGWLESGINVMFPIEVAAGTDMFWIRERYGKEARLSGGIDKRALALGKEAIRKELDRVAPMLEQGGYIPHLDHLVPPDISLEDYQYYRGLKKQLIGKR